MKSTKICNIIMLIINIINILINIGMGLNNDIITYGMTWLSSDTYSNTLLLIQSIAIPLCNFLMFIINIKNKKLRYIYLILSIYDLGSLFYFFNMIGILDIFVDYENIVIGIIVSVIILIHNLRNHEGKKRIIYSIITIVLAIVYLVALVRFEAYIQILLIIVLAILLIKGPIEQVIGIKRILSIIVISLAGASLIFLFINYKEVEKSAESVGQKIEQFIQNANVATERYIPVNKNGKWGYVDNKGNVKIDYQYDKASMMGEISLENDKGHNVNIALVKDGDKYKFISENNDTIIEFKPRSEIDQQINELGVFSEYFNSYMFLQALMYNTHVGVIQRNVTLERNFALTNNYNSYKEILPNNEESYEFELKGKKYTIQTRQEKREDNQVLYNGYELNHKYNNIKYVISDGSKQKEIQINLEENEDDVQVLKLYSDGYVPYCNIDEKIQGYYDENFNLKLVRGNYQILDIKDGYTIINQFDDSSNQTGIIVLDKNGRTMAKFKQITTIENGYIVKKENDKIVFLDNNFQEVTDEYDIINNLYEMGGFNFYLMGKKEDSKTVYYMLSSDNFKVLMGDIEQFISTETSDINGDNCQGTYALDDIYNIKIN